MSVVLWGKNTRHDADITLHTQKSNQNRVGYAKFSASRDNLNFNIMSAPTCIFGGNWQHLALLPTFPAKLCTSTNLLLSSTATTARLLSWKIVASLMLLIVKANHAIEYD
jgi:hypothetical protein